MTADIADVVVIGGGHNGLVCACYLAKAGLDVIVVEQNADAGGALNSSDWNGYRLEHGGLEHTAILTTGVVDELDLRSHGLEYATRTTSAVHRFGDGTTFVIEDTAEATAASIAAVSPADGEAWMQLVELSGPLFKAYGLASRGYVPSRSLARRFARVVGGKKAEPLLELVDLPATAIAQRWFTHPAVRALVVHRSSFIGLPPSAPGSGAAFLMTTSGHGRSYGRPIGGSAAFVASLTGALETAGGRLVTGEQIERLIRDGDNWRVESASGSAFVARKAVVSAMAPKEFLTGVLPGDALSGKVRRGVDAIETVVGNVNQLTLAGALDTAACVPDFGREDLRRVTMWLMGSPDDALSNYSAAAAGRLHSRIPTLLTFPSEMDPSAAPAGAATLWANSFTASRLADGRSWDDARSELSEAVWATIDACAPGVREHVVHEVLATPGDIALRGGAENPGGHVAPTARQSLGDRPAPGLGNYSTPVKGVFLTGAGVHPGGGVSGSPGRACAEAVLRSLDGGVSGRVGFLGKVAAQGFESAKAARKLPSIDESTE